RELVFVDDGSRDGTGERLDALAAEHPDVRVVHIPNSGWPGRPRNVGLETARGEFVFFADHDDWLEPDALERLYAATTEHAADIVIGKVVGHGGRRTAQLSRVDRHGLDAADVPLGLLTPHKLFRRALLEEHAIRFPEGEQRLEDHLFVVPAFFAAGRISVLVSHPVYHWVLRADRENSSSRRAAPDAHFVAVRELLAMVDARTEPGPVRDRYHAHWYRGKVLVRLGWYRGEPAYRAQVFAAARALIAERFPPRLDEALAFNFRLRARLARHGDLSGMEQLVAFESSLRARARVTAAHPDGDTLVLKVTGRLRRGGRRAIAFTRRGDGLLWEPPPELAEAFEEDERAVATLPGEVGIMLRSQEDETEWGLAVASKAHLPAAAEGEAIFPRVSGRARIDPAVAAGGGALPPGRYDVRATLAIAGFSAEAAARVQGRPLTITVSPAGKVIPSEHVGGAPRPASRLARVRARIARALRR
ncbi:MAG: poly(ribitol-phosphate) beta-N-acetylglucosaminyltransferase, partial [Solirubrobacteraceae bacterium]|nr:poly(ribitol-phosphate) beta-N-acetylglucosaminyltransferase [Solirubrobacteraceae bacterium]